MSFDPNHLPVNWVDFAIFLILIFGFTRGRRHGMSVEMMYLLQWIGMITGAAYAYRPAGDYLAQNTVFTRLCCYVTAYLVTLVVIRIGFQILRRLVGGKLVGSNIFGSGEYYLGMVAGVLRFACIIIAAMALLNARHFNRKEILAHDKYEKEVYGSDFFPDLHEVQVQVFKGSFLGSQVGQYLPFLLISPVDHEVKGIKPKQYDLPDIPQ
jgi:uncharacterized membrane protein required for colicin V production